MESAEVRAEAVPDTATPSDTSPSDPSQAPSAPQPHTLKKAPWFAWIIFNFPLLFIALVFPSKNFVSRQDTTFVGFAAFYIVFLSRVLVAAYSGKHSPRVLEPNKLLSIYIFVGTAMLGFVLPLVYFGYAYFHQISEGMLAVAPILYLLSCQLFTQYVANGLCFCLPARALVSVIYNSRLIIAAYDWHRAVGGSEEWLKPADGGAPHPWGSLWAQSGRLLAMVNLLYWIFNLFGFLLPIYLPRAFKKHYDLERLSRKKKK
ncbi:hypothetical protein CBR_g26263 [Chara braunii]|uniref:DUF7733 domain-containing protein n=1 Tax=Chara braunii TaxID=69332 RepID=A0A388L7E7_CHABU|nr:hypothetical protein CBR_g26263 [Chara braunii]|eukprot:GBG78229.1 hypothetical protein CBR_g26263 [Chara braunii]